MTEFQQDDGRTTAAATARPPMNTPSTDAGVVERGQLGPCPWCRETKLDVHIFKREPDLIQGAVQCWNCLACGPSSALYSTADYEKALKAATEGAFAEWDEGIAALPPTEARPTSEGSDGLEEVRTCSVCNGAGDDGHGRTCYTCDGQGGVVPFYHTRPTLSAASPARPVEGGE